MSQPPPLPPANPYAQPPPLPPSNPYAAPLARVEVPVSDDVELAGRGARLGAVILDNVFVAGLAMIAAVVLPQMEKNNQETALIVFGLVMGLGLIILLGFNLYYLHRDGQTLGKKIVGIRILRSDGSHCELWRIIVLRFLPVGLLGAIPLLGPIVSLVDALMIFGEERRCLHDLIADTIVVNV